MEKSLSLYNGEATLDFDDAKHCYVWREKGRPVAGVTSILRLLDKPALIQWAANSAVQYISQEYVAAHEQGEPFSISGFLALCQQAKTAHRRISKTATDVGSEVHAFAEAILAERLVDLPEDPQAAKGADAFLEWYKWHEIKPLAVERMILSREHYYAGTVDFFGHIDGELCVLDFKTSTGLYLEMLLQLAAYAVALEEETQEQISHGWIVRLDKKNGKPTAYYVPLNRNLKDAWLYVRRTHKAVEGVSDLLDQVKAATKNGERLCQTSMTSTLQAELT
jgi:hypothetical protein